MLIFFRLLVLIIKFAEINAHDTLKLTAKNNTQNFSKILSSQVKQPTKRQLFCKKLAKRREKKKKEKEVEISYLCALG